MTVVENRFARAARTYDRYAQVQRMAARQLLGRIGLRRADTIAEIGCGTGCYTEMLLKRYRPSRITATDTAEEMLETARSRREWPGTEFKIAHAASDLPITGIDLVTSNASLHWVHTIGDCLEAYYRMLRRGGVIAFSCFGPDTYSELRQSLSLLRGEHTALPSSFFPSRRMLQREMFSRFGNVTVEEMHATIRFASLYELLRMIKYTGTRGQGDGRSALWTARIIAKLERLYREYHGSLEATYHIIFCKGNK